MGNYMSCTFVYAPPLMTKNNTKATQVVFPACEVRQYRDLVKAGELMLECPHHFLTNSRSLQIGRRFSPLGADEDLELGNVYVFFHMRRANSIVMDTDVAVLFFVAKRLSGGRARKAPVPPEICGEGAEQETSEKTIPRLSSVGFDLGFQYRLTCRSRMVVLETIIEEPVCS